MFFQLSKLFCSWEKPTAAVPRVAEPNLFSWLVSGWPLVLETLDYLDLKKGLVTEMVSNHDQIDLPVRAEDVLVAAGWWEACVQGE
jgi:hypothetical protein